MLAAVRAIFPVTIDLSHLFLMLFGALLGFVASNIGSVFVGIVRVLDLLHELAVADAVKNATVQADEVALEIKSMPEREGFGRYVEH